MELYTCDFPETKILKDMNGMKQKAYVIMEYYG